MTRSNSRYGEKPGELSEPFDPATSTEPTYDNTPALRDEPVQPSPEERHEDTAAPGNVKQDKHKVKRSVAGGTWAALIVGALLLIMLLVFILQNQQAIELNLFAWTFEFPAGVGYLFSAIAGALIMALVGGVRMLELRRQVRRQS